MPSTIKQCKTMQNSCHAMRKIVQNEILLQAVHTCTPCSKSIFSAQNRVKSSRPYVHVSGRMRQPKKNWARKKRMASWARQRQQITEAPGLHGGGWCRRAEPAARPEGLRVALARGRAADPGGPALLLPPAASQQGLRLQPTLQLAGARQPAAAQRALAVLRGQGLLPLPFRLQQLQKNLCAKPARRWPRYSWLSASHHLRSTSWALAEMGGRVCLASPRRARAPPALQHPLHALYM